MNRSLTILLIMSAFLASKAWANPPTAPGDLRFLVYSSTAADVFWDRATDDGRIVGYEIVRNGELIGVRDTLGVFDDDLMPDVTYTYEVTTIDDEGNRSATAATSLNTKGGQGSGGDDPATPTGLISKVYSATAAELFWDRPTTFGLMYEVVRNGSIVATTDGVSYFDDTLSTDQGFRYDVIALDPVGNRSIPATITVNTGQTGPSESAINRDNYNEILTEVLDIYFAGSFDEPLTNSVRSVRGDGGFLSDVFDDNPGPSDNPIIHTCVNGGTAVIERGTFIQFSNCLIGEVIHDGNYSVNTRVFGLLQSSFTLTRDPDLDFEFSGDWRDAGIFFRLAEVNIHSTSPEGDFVLERANFSFGFGHRLPGGGGPNFRSNFEGSFILKSPGTNKRYIYAETITYAFPGGLPPFDNGFRYFEPFATHTKDWNFRRGMLKLTAEDGSELLMDADTGNDETVSIRLTNEGGTEEFISPWPIRLERLRSE